LKLFLVIVPKILRGIGESAPAAFCDLRRPDIKTSFIVCGQGRSDGSSLTFPEFAIGNGCADLYIPAKKWRLEILRNGDRLEQHSGRFSRPELYVGNFPVDDHIILNFAESYPAVAQSGKYILLIFVTRLFIWVLRVDLQNLYHVAFSDDFHMVSILDKKLELVPGGEFALWPA
jgi:hypothetical protein